MATGTKAVTKKVREERPPLEVRDNTKARRAWLAAKAAEIDATPNHSAKIVGQGSYQVVSVYETVQVAGRLRHRGVCQYCGASQVVQAGRMVLHGYNRPGWGYIVNRCPGVELAPFNTEKVYTERWLEFERRVLPGLEAKAAEFNGQADAAQTAYRAAGENEWNARNSYPLPPLRVRRGHGTEEENAALVAAVEAWRAKFPKFAAWQVSFGAASDARGAVSSCKNRIFFWSEMLAGKIHGSPLTEEVIA